MHTYIHTYLEREGGGEMHTHLCIHTYQYIIAQHIYSLRVCETGTRDARPLRHGHRARLRAVHPTGIYIYSYRRIDRYRQIDRYRYRYGYR